MRPAAIEGVLYPPPNDSTFQAIGGPALGQAESRPFSSETAVRSRPCHWGQSYSWARNSFSEENSKHRIGTHSLNIEVLRQGRIRLSQAVGPMPGGSAVRVT